MLGDNSTIIPNINNDDAHTSILHLEAELHKQSENCEKLSLTIKQGEVDLKKKDEEIVQQKNKASLLELELTAVKEERDQLKQDIEDSDLSKDQLVRKAWEVRDEAINILF
jgi:coiled-coil domain-containing protein 64